jgi:hypothetical protein
MANKLETKTDKFKRLSKKRMEKTIKCIRIIGNCASPNYEYSAEDVENIVLALEGEITKMKERFNERLETLAALKREKETPETAPQEAQTQPS